MFWLIRLQLGSKTKINILTARDIIPVMHLLEENGERGIFQDVGTGVAERVHNNKERRKPWAKSEWWAIKMAEISGSIYQFSIKYKISIVNVL